MYCNNCGRKIANNQKFCRYCGAKNEDRYLSESIGNSESSSQIQVISQSNVEFNRDVLKNYLFNIRTLEYAKNKLEQEKIRVERGIEELGYPDYMPSRTNILDYGAYFGGLIFMAVLFIIASWINRGLNGDGFFSIFQDLLQPIISIVLVACVVIAIIIVIAMIREYFQDQERYERVSREKTERIQSELEEREELLKILPRIKQDLMKTRNLLNDAYSINIIPNKFRNIYGAHSLYEYISTSTVSLKEALQLCKLDEISAKLDTVIEQQREMIMELARSNALQEKITHQNEEILRHVITTEKNTELAAHYNHVAAVHTKTMAQIESYYFFKNGL